jgi:hemerythrin-like domain-containing protein
VRDGKATEILKHEHLVIKKVLAAVERLVLKGEPGPVEPWRKALDFIRVFADQCHHIKEEKVLFPALEEHGIPREGGPIGLLLAEHEEGRRFVRAMAQALSELPDSSQIQNSPLAEHARAYLRLLEDHIQKEDEVLFEMANEALTDEEQEDLARRFEEYEHKEMGPGIHERYAAIAGELELLK